MLSSRTFLLLTLSALTMGSISCDIVECGNGTIEVDGQCTVPDAVTGPASCADGTIFDEATGQCVSRVECGENTVPETQPDGSIRCVGVGGGGGGQGCEGLMAECLPPSNPGTQVTVCGVLRDVQTNEQLSETVADDEVPALCDQSSPTATGPCSVQVRAFDPIQFAANPTGTKPLVVTQVAQDICGRYAIRDVPVPFTRFVAVATSNVFPPGTDGTDGEEPIADTYQLTGTSFGTAPGERRADIIGAVTRNETDVEWTVTAGCPFNEGGPGGDPCVPEATFADRGVYVPVYSILSSGQTFDGVKITANGTVLADLDYYFSDADADSRSTVDPAQEATGANGTGLLTPTQLRAHSGEGNEPAGCEWSTVMAASIPGVVFFQSNFAHVIDEPDNFECPQL